MKKDITSRDYWQTLANLGLAVGRSNLPRIEDVAEHILGLMRACDEAEQRAEHARKDARVLAQKVEIMLMKFSNEADELRDSIR